MGVGWRWGWDGDPSQGWESSRGWGYLAEMGMGWHKPGPGALKSPRTAPQISHPGAREDAGVGDGTTASSGI